MTIELANICLPLKRILIALIVTIAFCGAATGDALAQNENEVETVGDRLFIWGHPAAVYNTSYLKNFKPSTIEPVEAADLMGLRNMYFIRYEGSPQIPYADYYRPFKKMDRVLWSLTGAAGATSQEERTAAFELAAHNKNIVGFILDDFFHSDAATPEQNESKLPMAAALSPEQLRNIREQLVIGDRRLRLSVVMYTNQISPRARHHLQYVDEITLWTSNPDDLAHLEENLAKLKSVVGDTPIVLGCYMFDYGHRTALSVEHMKYQVELGYSWLREGNIQGMIFLGTPICDLELEAVDFTRTWVAEVKDQPLLGKERDR